MKNYISEYRFGQKYKRKKRHILLTIILILSAVIIIGAGSFGIQIIIEHFVIEDMQTWTSSLPSYWGGIIGGAISGFISFIGVFLTINYYRKSDAQKSRVEHMPFIYANFIRAEKHSIDLSKAPFIEITNRNYEVNKNEIMLMDVDLENIGIGFANTLVVHVGQNLGGIGYPNLFKVGEKKHLQLRFYLDDAEKHNDLMFGLQFIDCMTNEYIQMYTIHYSKKKISIESGYPQFIGQSHSIGA